MRLDKEDLNAIGDMIDEKLLDFHEKVTAPMIGSKLLDFHEKVTAPMTDNVVDSLKEEIASTDNKIDRIERKLDAITDMLAVRVTDHEKRITKLEALTA